MQMNLKKIATGIILLLAVVGAVGGGIWYWQTTMSEKSGTDKKVLAEKESKSTPPVELVSGSHDTIRISPAVIESLGIKFTEAHPAPRPDPLQLAGSLFMDSNHLVRLHSRFAGDVVSIGTVEEDGQQRPLRFGDRVKKGQVLAIVWSKEIGEKKSELVDAISSFSLRKSNLDRLKSLTAGVVPQKQIYEAERDFQAAQIAVERAERTLRAWNLADELKEVYEEAERIQSGKAEGDPGTDKRWAQIPIVANLDGEILEVNVTAGEYIDTNLDLFKIGDLSRLGVFAQAYEDDLPAIQAIPPNERNWTIHFKTNSTLKPLEGKFNRVGEIIDPTQHTATVIGWVDNSRRQMKVGQFITAEIHLPEQPGEVCVPSSAVIDDGNRSIVMVAGNDSRTVLKRRSIAIVRRGTEHTCIRIQPTADEKAAGAEPLREGELVVSSGVLELEGALENLQSEQIARQ
jgi:cobalt-zinc-cadmium efflux system membrane fusion protein